jgi:MFS family permease
MPFYLITARGWSAGQAGLLMIVQPIVMAFLAPTSGWISDRIGSRAPASLGMLCLAVGLFGLSRLDAETPIIVIALIMVLTGLGLGLFASPNNSAIMGAVPANRRGVAAGVVATARQIGLAFGVAISGSLFAALLTSAGGTIAAAGPPFFFAFDWTFKVIAALALIGVFTSYNRGSTAKPAPAPRPSEPAGPAG